MSPPHPPPPEGSGLYRGFDLTSGQILPDGGKILCSNPPVNNGFLSPKQLHTSKQVIKAVFTTQSQGICSMGQYGANISGQIRPRMSGGGGVVGQHIDRCIIMSVRIIYHRIQYQHWQVDSIAPSLY